MEIQSVMHYELLNITKNHRLQGLDNRREKQVVDGKGKGRVIILSADGIAPVGLMVNNVNDSYNDSPVVLFSSRGGQLL